MKTRDLERMGIPAGEPAEAAKQLLQKAHSAKRSVPAIVEGLKQVVAPA